MNNFFNNNNTCLIWSKDFFYFSISSINYIHCHNFSVWCSTSAAILLTIFLFPYASILVAFNKFPHLPYNFKITLSILAEKIYSEYSFGSPLAEIRTDKSCLIQHEKRIHSEIIIYQSTCDFVKLYIGYFSNRIPVWVGLFTLENLTFWNSLFKTFFFKFTFSNSHYKLYFATSLFRIHLSKFTFQIKFFKIYFLKFISWISRFT